MAASGMHVYIRVCLIVYAYIYVNVHTFIYTNVIHANVLSEHSQSIDQCKNDINQACQNEGTTVGEPRGQLTKSTTGEGGSRGGKESGAGASVLSKFGQGRR